MMQRRQPGHISSINGALILQQKIHHRHGPDGSCSVQRERSPPIFHPGGGFVGDEFAGGFNVVFGGGEVEGGLAAEVWRGLVVNVWFDF